MSKKEMKEELFIEPEEINIIKNIEKAKEIIEKEHLIPKNINYIIGIEGLDYLEKIDDIDVLYDLGVRSVNPVWNNHNKFGTGVRPCTKTNKENGLTPLGKELIWKLIKTGIIIDVSHSDEQTFWDIISECQKHKNLKPKIMASHSNCKAVYNVPRNLDDEQIKAIGKLNGVIGIVQVKNFCGDKNYEQAYIEHIKHVKQILKTTQNIAISTDDMSYYKINKSYYQNFNIFKQEKFDSELTKIMNNENFTKLEIEKIKNNNFYQNTCKNCKV